MYMLRAYQSPASTDDCGPQCAQMPNFASRNHSGTWYLESDWAFGWNGPAAICDSGPFCAAKLALPCNAGIAPARIPTASRRVTFMPDLPFTIRGVQAPPGLKAAF